MTDALYLAALDGADVGVVVEITGDEGRHAATVKRTRVGERVMVADGRGHAIRGEVIEAEKSRIAVQVEEMLTARRSPHRWTAVQGLAKRERAEIAVEALTELGVDEIIAWQAERSVSRWDGKVAKGITKWIATAKESTKQSRRFMVPEIRFASTDIVEVLRDHDLVLVAHEEAMQTLADLELPRTGRIAVVVGPEGGISPAEIERFTGVGARFVSLGDGVLRTSSAGLVALAQLQLLAAQQTGRAAP